MQTLTAHIQIFHSLRAKLCKKSTYSGIESTFSGTESTFSGIESTFLGIETTFSVRQVKYFPKLGNN